MGMTRGPEVDPMLRHFGATLAYYLVSLFVAFKYVDVYRQRRFLTGNREAGRITQAIFAFTLVNAVLAYLLPTKLLFSRLTLGLSFVSCTGLVLLGRHLVTRLRTALRREGFDTTVALIVGTGPVGRLLAQEIHQTPLHGYRLLGFLEEGEEAEKGWLDGVRVFGGRDRLQRVCRRLRVEEVFVCRPEWEAERIMDLFTRLRPFGVRIRLASNLFNVVIERVGVPVDAIGETPILDFGAGGMHGWRRVVKRGIDVVVAAALLLLLSPIWIAIALAILLEDGRPVLHRQTRLGEGGAPFTCYKFRSMIRDAETRREELEAANEMAGPVFKIRDDPRITKVGRLLRTYSLDEAPQLWNVLRGDMSLVGPRPPLPREVSAYDAWHKKRLQGPMGLSGLWQVSGRNELDFEDMVLLDIYYLRNQSLFLDYRILVRTLFTVLLGQGR